jgi:hypothetical protein
MKHLLTTIQRGDIYFGQLLLLKKQCLLILEKKAKQISIGIGLVFCDLWPPNAEENHFAELYWTFNQF